jgi:transposase
LIIASITASCNKTHLVSLDEKTRIQAISRIEMGMSRGKNQKHEYEYERHGTSTLIAALDVGKGSLVHHYQGQTRNEDDFWAFCQATKQLYPKEDELVFMLDQLNTHKSTGLVKWVAEEIGFEGDLGRKGKKEILKSMSSRMVFLETQTHWVRFVYTPKHCSWLNPIENWFANFKGI